MGKPKMKKRRNQIFNVIIGSLIGVWIGHSIYVYWDYRAHPDLYALQSAPWYTSILSYSVFTLIFVLILLLLKIIFSKR